MSKPEDGSPWYIVDGLAPFFREVTAPRVNWSKIPFADLETGGQPDQARLARIRDDFQRFCAHAAAYGFNAITLDEVAHLADDPDHPPALRSKIAVYQEEFARQQAMGIDTVFK